MREFVLGMVRLLAWPLHRYAMRHLVYRFDLGGDAPPAPDYTPVANASKESAELAAKLGQAQLDEAKRQYDQNSALAKQVANAQLGIMQQTSDQGKDYYEYGKSFRPLEQQMLGQVQGNLTPAQIVRLGVSGLKVPSALPAVSSSGQKQAQPAATEAPKPVVQLSPVEMGAPPVLHPEVGDQQGQMALQRRIEDADARARDQRLPPILSFANRQRQAASPRFPAVNGVSQFLGG